MTKKVLSRKGNMIITIFLLVISIIYTVLVKTVDVKAIGPDNSEVGFSKLNESFKNLVGYKESIYKITELLGLVILLLVAFYGINGLIQLIKNKSLKKVDRELIVLGVFYAVVLLTYVFFEKVVINYRPFIIDGSKEASYPSSHTMLALCVGISSLMISKKYMNRKYLKIFNIATIVIMSLVFIGRTISGVHWISDIIGGVLISMTLIMCFKTVLHWNRKTNSI